MTQQPNRDENAVQPMLPQEGRAAIYARVAQRARQTPQPQTDGLLAFANKQGYCPEQITIFEDRNASGRTAIAGREAFNALLEAVAHPQPDQEPIQAIVVSSEDRLFRDQVAVDLAHFITVCADHSIQLLTPTTTYDFTSPDQVALFRLQCEQAGKLRQRSRTRGSATQKPEDE